MKIYAESALEAAGLSGEDFTPFMRVRVIGLTSKCFPNKGNQQTGLITIWNPTEKQVPPILIHALMISLTNLFLRKVCDM